MKYIITEEQNIKLQVLRRGDEIRNFISTLYPWDYPCDYNNFHYFLIALRHEFFIYEEFEWFDKINQEEVWRLIVKLFENKFREHYKGWCLGEEETIN